MRCPTLLVFCSLTLCRVLPAASETPRSVPVAQTEVVGYFPQWGIYERLYVPLDLIRSGAVRTLTQLDYALGTSTTMPAS